MPQRESTTGGASGRDVSGGIEDPSSLIATSGNCPDDPTFVAQPRPLWMVLEAPPPGSIVGIKQVGTDDGESQKRVRLLVNLPRYPLGREVRYRYRGRGAGERGVVGKTAILGSVGSEDGNY